jgi:hypothetical protein
MCAAFFRRTFQSSVEIFQLGNQLYRGESVFPLFFEIFTLALTSADIRVPPALVTTFSFPLAADLPLALASTLFSALPAALLFSVAFFFPRLLMSGLMLLDPLASMRGIHKYFDGYGRITVVSNDGLRRLPL